MFNLKSASAPGSGLLKRLNDSKNFIVSLIISLFIYLQV